MRIARVIHPVCFMSVFLISLSGVLCAANLDGSLFLYNPGGQSPTALDGYQVELVESRTQTKADSSVTDSYGRFSPFRGSGKETTRSSSMRADVPGNNGSSSSPSGSRAGSGRSFSRP